MTLVNPKASLGEVLPHLNAVRRVAAGGQVSFESPLDGLSAAVSQCCNRPDDIVYADFRSLVTSALFKAGTRDITVASFTATLGHEVRGFRRRSAVPFVLATTIVMPYEVNMKARPIGGCRFRFRYGLPPTFDFSHVRSIGDHHLIDQCASLCGVLVTVKARSNNEAMSRAGESLDCLRGMWNFAVNRGILMRHVGDDSVPVNELLPGPFQTLHKTDGERAGDWYWTEDDYRHRSLARRTAPPMAANPQG